MSATFRRVFSRAIVTAIASAVLGCNPYKFTMGDTHLVRCEVMTGLHSIEQNNMVATMHDASSMSMSSFGTTEYNLRIDTKLTRGLGFRVMLRPIVEERFVRDSGIAVTLTTEGVSVDSGGRQLYARSDVRVHPNTQLPLFLFSDNHFAQLIYGCDTIFSGFSTKLETDDIVLQTLPASEVQIIHPNWVLLPQFK